MKIAVAQIRPTRGDIRSNIDRHRTLIDLAVPVGAELIVFPELSVTGYEPTLANGLAMDLDDCRFDVFQNISDAKHITLGIGAPTKSREGICISLLLFQPRQARHLYSKMHLHPDEQSFFVHGQRSTGLIGKGANAALAICYELSVPEHAANASKNGAETYIASVAKAVSGIDMAITRLSQIAHAYSMTVLMSNCVGLCDDCECAGKTSAWSKKGVLLSQLDGTTEGIIMIDTETQAVMQRTI
jgi:predicted amidohydrolase